MIAKIIKIYGDVQGVSYRYFARTEAENLQLVGYAQNEHDGSVTVFVQGNEDNVNKMENWCQSGSPMSTVKNIESSQAEINNDLRGFEVK